MYRVLFIIGFGALAACSRDSEPESLEPASAPIDVGQPMELALRDRPCDGAPAWTRLDSRCRAGESVYAVGVAREIPSRSMRIHVAADRARAGLTEVGTSLLVHSEVLDLSQCEESTQALARRPATDSDQSLPACGDRVEERAVVLVGCPEWSTALATLEGERVHGVGYVAGVKNPQMARSLASNRAIAEQRKTLGLQVTRGQDGSVSTGTTSDALALQEDAQIETCGELTIARVSSRLVK